MMGALLTLGAKSHTFAQNTTDDNQQVRVQITEIGCLRTLVMVNENVDDVQDLLSQQLIDTDFRVFPAAKFVQSTPTSEQMKAAGEEANADLIVYAQLSDRPYDDTYGSKLYEGTANVKIFSRVSGELLVSKTVHNKGKRTTDEVDAKRSARESALKLATTQAIERELSKAHKTLVHEAVIVNVYSDSALLAMMEYIGKMEGVYHVKRLKFDHDTHEALVEIIGSPRSETFWRAYLEKMPKTKVNVAVTPNGALRNKYPAWFLPPTTN